MSTSVLKYLTPHNIKDFTVIFILHQNNNIIYGENPQNPTLSTAKQVFKMNSKKHISAYNGEEIAYRSYPTSQWPHQVTGTPRPQPQADIDPEPQKPIKDNGCSAQPDTQGFRPRRL